MTERVLVAWCPDWPVVAVAGLTAEPVAVLDKGAVFAANPAARAYGVRRGLRRREAEGRCPQLRTEQYRPEEDARAYEPVVAALEEVVSGVHPLRPGLVAIRARGPAGYYGGEEEAALWLLDRLDEAGAPGSRIGVADGVFTAEHAARTAHPQRIRIVPEGGAAAFLAPLPVGLLDDGELVSLLERLGLATLGGFAALPAETVRDRFGPRGARLHALAGGLDSRHVAPRTPPQEFETSVELEPPLDRVDQAAFAVRADAEAFIERLTGALLVCTALRVELITDRGGRSERIWSHPRSFTASEVVDRVRWQLQGAGDGRGLPAPLARVVLAPEQLDRLAHHEQGLWGTAAEERIHHALSRVQSILGHSAVVTASLSGGRSPVDRIRLTPWGERLVHAREPERPWPGHLPQPAPSIVYSPPRPVRLLGAAAEEVGVDERGLLDTAPARLQGARGASRITAWAGPWPNTERWWDAAAARTEHRVQAIDAEGRAWLLLRSRGQWWIEAGWE